MQRLEMKGDTLSIIQTPIRIHMTTSIIAKELPRENSEGIEDD